MNTDRYRTAVIITSESPETCEVKLTNQAFTVSSHQPMLQAGENHEAILCINTVLGLQRMCGRITNQCWDGIQGQQVITLEMTNSEITSLAKLFVD